MNGSLDTLISGLMAHAAGQLEVLKDSLRNVRNKAMINLQLSDDACSCTDKSLCSSPLHLSQPNKQLEDEIYKEILDCIGHHKAIIE